jgi:hypothetical protein
MLTAPVPASSHRQTPVDREARWALASTTCARGGAKLEGVKDDKVYWKGASDA